MIVIIVPMLNAVMEQNIAQDEQANNFSAELRIRKTQVCVLYYFDVVTFLLSRILNLVSVCHRAVVKV